MNSRPDDRSFRANKNKPWVLISVHKVVRELDSKIYLALELVGKSFDVVLGRTSTLINNAEILPRGIYCDVRHLSLRRRHFERFNNAGSKVVAFDEEATSFTDPSDFAKQHISMQAVACAEQCYTWGPHHHDTAITAVGYELQTRFLCTGHPRFDMLRHPGRLVYDNDVSEYKAKFGSFILLTSNTGGWIQSRQLDEKWNSYVARGLIQETLENYHRFVEEFEHRTDRHNSLVSLVGYLATYFPKYNVVIRPHFTETVQQWAKSLVNVPSNVHIIHEGSSVPWIMAAKVVIHSSCTSGTEAFIAGTPCIAYRAVRDERFDAELPNSLSVEASTADEVIALVKCWLSEPQSYELEHRNSKLDLYDRYFAAREGATAAQRVAEAMSEIAFTDPANAERLKNLLQARGVIPTSAFGFCSVLMDRLIRFLRFTKRKIKDLPLIKKGRGANVKDPEITKDVIVDRIERLKVNMNWSPDTTIEVTDLGGEMFMIRKVENAEMTNEN